jgi:starvation-inducible DNA-binding protein
VCSGASPICDPSIFELRIPFQVHENLLIEIFFGFSFALTFGSDFMPTSNPFSRLTPLLGVPFLLGATAFAAPSNPAKAASVAMTQDSVRPRLTQGPRPAPRPMAPAPARTIGGPAAPAKAGPNQQESAANDNAGVAAQNTPIEALKLNQVPALPLNPERARVPIGERIPLDKAKREKVATELQGLLVDLIDLRLQTTQSHWDLVGPFYLPVHEFLGDAADRYAKYADRVAERSLSLGYSVDGRPSTVAAQSGLAVHPNGFVRDSEAIDLLSDRLDTIALRTRARMEKVGDLDPVTENMLQELIEGFEHDLWQLRAHKQ